MLTLSYQFKCQPNKIQIEQIEHSLNVCRSVWNFALRQRKDWYASRKCSVNSCSLKQEYILPADEPFPNYHRQAKGLTLAKKEIPVLKSINAQVLQQVLRTLDKAFTDMKNRNFGFPRFKKADQMRSYVYPQMLIDCLRGNKIKLPQLGWIKLRKSREIPDGFLVKQARIVKKASGYFIVLSLQFDVEVPSSIPHGHPLGLDLGFEKVVATSDGELIKRPKFLVQYSRKLKLLQRILKRKQKGSKSWLKLQKKIARLHQKIAETRKDYHFKLAHHLASQAGMIFVEDLNFRSWAGGMLSKQATDFGFGQFVNILEWVCFRTDTYFQKVDKNYTSQECPECGRRTGKKKLSQRIHECRSCGYTTDRDVAASQVVRNRGLMAVGQPVKENAGVDGLTGINPELDNLVKNR